MDTSCAYLVLSKLADSHIHNVHVQACTINRIELHVPIMSQSTYMPI